MAKVLEYSQEPAHSCPLPNITDCTGVRSLQVIGHKGGCVHQLTAKNMQKGMTEVQKCQKAA